MLSLPLSLLMNQIGLISSINAHVYPLLGIMAYMAYPKDLRIHPSLLYKLSILHNGTLIIFSGWTFVTLFNLLYTDFSIEPNYYFKNPTFDRIIYLFYLSKYYEFIDTFLLYLNNKNPIFLQKFHHIGAVACWHLLYVYKIDCIWVPTLANSFIHTIMYFYYLECILKIRWVRYIKQYITCLQLTQFIVPISICVYNDYPNESTFNWWMIKIMLFYVFIIVILFIEFYIKTYVKKLEKSEKICQKISTD